VSDTAAWDRILDEHPQFRRTVTDFMMLLDARRVLEHHQPPMHETAAAYLEEVGRTLMVGTGLPDEFVEACIKVQPSHAS
jgi:hypothetical protein